MNKKHRILIDSTVYLSKDIIAENEIEVVSLNVTDGTKTYPEVTVDNNFIWQKQDEGVNWKTSQPAPGDFLKTYQKLLDEGAEYIFCVLLSKEISGTYQSALLAKNMLEEPEKVILFDTQLCAYATEMIAMELIDMVNKDLPKDSIIERIEKIISTSKQMFTVENLFSLTKGGRLSVAKAAIGTVLRIKPVIEVRSGKPELVKSERTLRKIFDYFVNQAKNRLKDILLLHFTLPVKIPSKQRSNLKSDYLRSFLGVS